MNSAREIFRQRFLDTKLWRAAKTGTLDSIGNPSEVTWDATATVRDCVAGAKTTLGTDCSNSKDNKSKARCCSEKFVGPEAVWHTPQGDFVLYYSPDPSVRLKAPRESKHRYWNVMDRVRLK